MKFIPHSYQRYAIERMISEPALGLFLDMGLGRRKNRYHADGGERFAVQPLGGFPLSGRGPEKSG